MNETTLDMDAAYRAHGYGANRPTVTPLRLSLGRDADMPRDLPCPTCGARGAEPCETFDTIGPGTFGPRYACAPHVWRDMTETYWRAVAIRTALVSREGES